MAVEFTLICDRCNKRGPRTVGDGNSSRDAIDEIRALADGFTRLRPKSSTPLEDLCPRCVKKLDAEKAKSEKAAAKPPANGEPKTPAKAKPKAKAKAKAK